MSYTAAFWTMLLAAVLWALASALVLHVFMRYWDRKYANVHEYPEFLEGAAASCWACRGTGRVADYQEGCYVPCTCVQKEREREREREKC